MKILLAPDSFKGALSAPEAARAMARGLLRVWPDAECVSLPVADGGEGTLETLVSATGGRRFGQTVTGPLGTPTPAHWGLLGDGETAVVELASASGLTLLTPENRDPLRATTFGVGELLRSALTHPGVRRVIIGLGGSATNDGGAGLLSALGIHFLDSAGQPLPPGGAALSRLVTVQKNELPFDPDVVTVILATDVDNPLTGPRGASAVFGPQKGATPTDVAHLDYALSCFARVLKIDVNGSGSGAAGGAAAGLLYLFPHAILRSGIDLVLETIGFDSHLPGTDLVLTGEGRLDQQTLGGKAIAGVARRAKAAGVPVGAIVGSLAPALDPFALAETMGVTAVLSVAPGPCSLEESMAHARPWLEAATERAARWMTLLQSKHRLRDGA